MSVDVDARPVFIDDDHCVRTIGDVIVTLTRAPPTGSYLEAWSDEADRVVRRLGSLAVCTVISQVAPAPSDEAKSKIRRVLTRYEGRMRGLAYVVEGSGFSAAAMRSALTLMALVARYAYPQKIFANARDGSDWIAEVSRYDHAKGLSVNGPELAALVSLMRVEHDRRIAKAG